MTFSYPIPTQKLKRLIISSNFIKRNAFGSRNFEKLQEANFHRSE